MRRDAWIEAIGGRKFVLCVLTISAATVLVWNQKISDQVWSGAVMASVGAYILGNVGQRKVEAGAAGSQ